MDILIAIGIRGSSTTDLGKITMTMIEACAPGTHCCWSYETKEPADVERWLGFLRNRGFTEIVKMREEIPFILTCPSGAECTKGWFVEQD